MIEAASGACQNSQTTYWPSFCRPPPEVTIRAVLALLRSRSTGRRYAPGGGRTCRIGTKSCRPKALCLARGPSIMEVLPPAAMLLPSHAQETPAYENLGFCIPNSGDRGPGGRQSPGRSQTPAGGETQPAGGEKQPVRGSLVEDRAARKLLEAGDARYDSDEHAKAVEVWQSVIERYPRSKVRFDAHMRLGNYLLDRERAYDRARTHFEADGRRGKQGRRPSARRPRSKWASASTKPATTASASRSCADVIEKFPTSPEVNQAYYYIGLGHFQLGHYSRAISALEKVGTALVTDDGKLDKVEAGKRLFVKIEDADLAALANGQVVKVRCQTTQGDIEVVKCCRSGTTCGVVLGSILTTLGKPVPDNGLLEVRGDDKVQVTYVDQHTADRSFDRPVLKEIQVVGDGLVDIMDGAYSESLRGVVLGRPINLQVTDADHDTTDNADTLKAVIEVYREKTTEEIEAEQAALATKAEAAAPAGTPVPAWKRCSTSPKSIRSSRSTGSSWY